jgi:hypothetical protein
MTFVKWITCEVDDHDGFDAAQRRWSAIAGTPGLIVQTGGWDSKSPTACVLGCWTDAGTYKTFMEQRHDQVFGDSGQQRTYRSIEVATGESELTMPGTLGKGALLRVADCQVRPERREHFVTVQREVWIPRMAVAEGMLGGLFSRLGEDRYLVTSGGAAADAHRRYGQEDVPALRDTAGAGDDLVSLRGYAVPLEPEWLVWGAW